MGLLQPIETGPGYLKAMFQGRAGSGKTRTAVELACHIHRHFGSKKPVAFFDTETGSDYVAGIIREKTGLQPLRVRTRAFTDLMEVAKECCKGASDILIVDSITHVWREVCDAYLQAINAKRSYAKTRLEVQDWGAIKKTWAAWPDMFLNSPVHIIVCGREGDEWGTQENEETGKLESVIVGDKMKVEGEFAFEGSLQVSMEKVQQRSKLVVGKDKKQRREAKAIINVATVIKDRFDVINGAVFDMPTGEDFHPHVALLNPSQHAAVDVAVKSDRDLNEMGENEPAQMRRERAILCEEIAGLLVSQWPGQSAADKKAKGEALQAAFNTRSWTAVENKFPHELREGLDHLKNVVIPGMKNGFEVKQEAES